jgi:uncharacterized membrane protein
MKREFAKHFPLVLATFLLLDAAWLGLVAPRFYQSQIGYLLRDTPNWYAAGVFYLVYISGLTIFVVTPAIRGQSLWWGVAKGAWFGVVTYATYDLTNLATIRDWPLLVTLVDLAWGATLCAATTFVSAWIGRRRIACCRVAGREGAALTEPL